MSVNTINPPTVWSRLPDELWDIVAEHIIGETAPLVPASRHEHFPVLYPLPSWREKTNLYAMALTCRAWYTRIMERAWRHVVVSNISHVLNVLESQHHRYGFYQNTLRCDIMLPAGPTYAAVPTMLLEFPNLRSITVDSPTLQFFVEPHVPLPATITSVQIHCLPRRFRMHHLLRMSDMLPELDTLQIVAAPEIDLSPMPTFPLARPALRKLSHLSLGFPCQFLFDPPPLANDFLALLAAAPLGSVTPALHSLAVEKHVQHTPTFLQTHGSQLRHLSCPTVPTDLSVPGMLSDNCRSLTSLTLVLDTHTFAIPPLPPSVSTIVVLLPFVRQWRKLSTVPVSAQRCFERLKALPAQPAVTIYFEIRGAMDARWLRWKSKELTGDPSYLRPLEFR